MASPKGFISTREQALKLVQEQVLANVIGQLKGQVLTCALPLQLVEEASELYLEGHIAKNNPLVKCLCDMQQVLAVFNGPHAYVSSSWYDHQNVPTWNYANVEISGNASLMKEEAELLRHLEATFLHYERSLEAFNKLPDSYVNANLKAIVGFRIHVQEIKGNFKLSQNKDDKNHRAIVRKLRDRNHGDDLELADLMSRVRAASEERE